MRPYPLLSILTKPSSKVALFAFLSIMTAGIVCDQPIRAVETGASTPNLVVSYQIVAPDLQELGKNAGIVNQLRELQAQTDGNGQGFETAVKSIIAEAPEKYHAILSKLLEKPKKTTVYKFTDQSLTQLASKGVPEDILAAVKGQAAKTYADRQELNAAIDNMLPSPYESYLALIVESAEKRMYGLTDRFFEDLKKADMPANVMTNIEHLNGQLMSEKNDLIEAVTAVITLDAAERKSVIKPARGADKPRKPKAEDGRGSKYVEELRTHTLSEQSLDDLKNNNIPETVMTNAERLRSQKTPEKTEAAETVTPGAAVKQKDNMATEIMGELRKLKADDGRDSKYIQEIRTYSLSEQALDDLKNNKIPDTVISLLTKEKIVGVTYSDKQVFEKEVKPALENAKSAGGPYRSLILASAEKQESFKISQKNINSVIGELSKGQIPADILEQLGPIQNIEYPNEAVFKSAISTSLKNADAIRPYIPLIVQQARKEHALLEGRFEPNIIQGDDCDCYRDDFSQLTYALYPFWQIEKQQAESPEQRIDLSVLARIGLYSFPIDAKGDVQRNLRWLKQIDELFQTAHKYRTQVDLVLYNPQWKQWGQQVEQQQIEIDGFASNIVKILQPSGHRAIDWFTTRIGNRKTVEIDGLTIDLNGFVSEDKRYYIKLIKEIRKGMQAIGNEYYLNLIIPGQGIDDIVNVLSDLREIIPDNETQTGPVDYFIVFLESPIKINKKNMRVKIEEKFKGIERRNVLRKIIPVMSHRGYNKNDFGQLFDDLIYFEDNYGGVGFWPAPVIKDENGRELNTLLREVFQRGYGDGTGLNDLVAMACKIICPNRWLVRIIWDIFIFLALSCLILYYSVCSVREIINKYFLFIFVAVVLPFVLIGLGLLFCDPAYSRISEGNGPLLFIIFGVIVYSIVNYRLKKKKADLP